MQLSRERSAHLKLTLFAIAVLMLTGIPAAVSQITTAAIHGTVTDPSGAVVPNAKIAAVNSVTGIETDTLSNSVGFYIFPSLQIGGPYTVTFDAPGFSGVKRTGIMLTVNANLEENAVLQIGTSLQTVSVDASALEVETANTQLEQVIPGAQIINVPILLRDAASLERLAPGVVEASDDTGAYSVNGSQNGANSYRLDGIDINDFALQDEGFEINPDALAEINFISSTINPEFARNSGSIVNEAIKSGTNTIHGSGFEYYRDTFMNLPGYFALPGERTPFHQNLYGGTLGGPIIKNKLFGFLAYQGYRRREGGIQETPIFQSGVFSNGNFTNENNIVNGGANGVVGLSANPIPFNIKLNGNACGPGTGDTTWNACFPGSGVSGSPATLTILPGNFNSLASALVTKYVPLTANAGTVAAPLYNFPTANTGEQDQGVLRADYHITDKDSIYGVGLFQSSPSFDTLPFGYTTSQGATLPGFGQVNAEHLKLFSATETHTFGLHTLNVLRAAYYRLNYAAVEPAQVVDPSSAGFNIAPQSPAAGLPVMALTGLFNLGFSSEGPQPRKDTNLNYSDDFSHLIGSHNLKFGVTFEQFRVSNPFYGDNNGLYSYAGSGPYSSGDPGIDFLLGIPDSYTQQSGGFIDSTAWEYYAYAQDSWRATPDLTINYGLSWDVETPTSDRQYGGEGVVCFQPGTATSNIYPGDFPGLLYPGDPGCNDSGGATTKYAHFGPRLGFAWSPSGGLLGLIGGAGQHRLSIRGGFGLYYNRDIEEGQLQNLSQPPILKGSSGAADFECTTGDYAGFPCSPAFANPFADVAGNGSEANPFPYSLPKPGSTLNWSNYTELDMSTISPAYSVPYVYNFNLNIQRQLPGNMILQVGYVGSVGHRLVITYDADPITPAGHTACLANPTCIKDAAQQHLDFPENTAQPVTTGGVPDYKDVGAQGTEGSSNYNSLQTSLVNNTRHGLYFSLAYTYSHALDDDSGLTSSGFTNRGRNTVPGYEYLNYGDSDYDARHRLSASYDYRVPLLASMNQNSAVKEILGDWHISGFTILQTGFPILITDAGVYNSLWCDAYVYYGCADDVNTSSFKIKTFNPRSNLGGVNQYFDTSTFSQEAIGTFGNVRRNFFHGAGYDYTNLSVYKMLPLGHDTSRNLQIMLQAANVFNHANFALPDGNYTDGLYFGGIRGLSGGSGGNDYNQDPADGRTVQIVGKITF
jgi:hypothetical protein